ncbi:MAG: DUF2945 domain-containing protein [Alphaproteobacteria bacterium]
MTKDLHKGDKVKWNTPQGMTEGKITEVNGSGDDARYKVESAKSGKTAIHKGDALKRT